MRPHRCRFCIVAIAVWIGGSGCHQWEHGTELEGVRYQKVRVIEGAGSPVEPSLYSIGLLDGPVEIDGRRYFGWMHRRRDGSIAGSTLAQATEVSGVPLPQGTWVAWDGAGALVRAHFPENQRIQGNEVRGGPGGAKGVSTGFYPSGALRSFFGAEDIEVDGVPVQGDVFHLIDLHEDGRLKRATLSQDFELQGQALSRGESIELAADGSLAPSMNR